MSGNKGKRSPKTKRPRGKPFSEGDDSRRNLLGTTPVAKRRIAEAANACNSIFMEEMFKEVEVLIGGNLVQTTHYRLFIQQLIRAGIRGNTPAKKLVLDFMSKQEARETDGLARLAGVARRRRRPLLRPPRRASSPHARTLRHRLRPKLAGQGPRRRGSEAAQLHRLRGACRGSRGRHDLQSRGRD